MGDLHRSDAPTPTRSWAIETTANTVTLPNLPTICCVDDFQRVAQQRLPKALYEYLASGTDREQTLRENQAAFLRYYLRPRMLRPVGDLSPATTLLGQSLAFPVLVSPAGVMGLCDAAEGEYAAARACGRMEIPYGLSQHATRSIEEVAAAAPDTALWYQIYILKDRSRTISLMERAVRAGYRGFFLTVDSVRFGYREADARNGFNALPPPHRLANYDDPSVYNSQKHASWDQNSEEMFDQNLSWDDVAWVKQYTQGRPLVIKGIMTGEDAHLAVEAGADAVMVSNHGGRQLDGALATIDALPEVSLSVQGRIPILLDSGVRRGTDVVKAIALGATAVGLGKPVFFALGIGGEEAVVQMLRMLKTEFEAAMALCGCRRVDDIDERIVGYRSRI